MTRVILYTGKGGVGKTSVAAATALQAAEKGYKTIVLSTDPAHSLSDAFDLPLSGDPTPVTSNVWGQEIDVLKEMESYWSTVKEWLSSLMQWQGVEEVVAEELAVLPGMEEMVGLLYIVRYCEENEFDVLIIDSAPTGETLRLLSFPDMARWYMRRLFPLGRRTATALGPLAQRLMRIPAPSGKVFDTLEDLFHRLDRMHAILTNPQSSSIRLVVNAEKMVVKEAQRTFTFLNLYGYQTDLVVCNRLIPDSVEDPFFQSWREIQGRHYKLIEESFSPIPILNAPLLGQEVVGLEALGQMARAIFGDRDPTQFFFKGSPQEILREDHTLVMRLRLPFVAKGDISLTRSGDELIIQVGRYRRNVILPQILLGLVAQEAKLEGQTLKIRFQKLESQGR